MDRVLRHRWLVVLVAFLVFQLIWLAVWLADRLLLLRFVS